MAEIKTPKRRLDSTLNFESKVLVGLLPLNISNIGGISHLDRIRWQGNVMKSVWYDSSTSQLAHFWIRSYNNHLSILIMGVIDCLHSVTIMG